ncbi:MAG: hypothetical protein HOH33_14235 [Verrucomicrobia bacterium]|jgi:hypothetical protein|nr:hypothetical protein [Verrucomicrobiota bacterium]
MSKLDNSKPKFIRTTFPRVREIQRPHGPQIVSQFEEWNKELQPYGKSIEEVIKDFLQEVINIKNQEGKIGSDFTSS